MEPKPKGINPERTRIEMLPWVRQAAAEYKPIVNELSGLHLQVFETSIIRGRNLLNLIETTHGQLDHPPQIMVAGIGLKNFELRCSVIPQKISARLHRLGIPHQMTLVDNNPDVLHDVRTRDTLFQTMSKSEKPQVVKEWEAYLADTGQSDSLVTAPRPGLTFDNGTSESPGITIFLNIHAAAVPGQFHTDLANGTIKLLEQDMARADFAEAPLFDYASLQNLLLHTSKAGQQLMVANAAAHIAAGGYMLINDPDSGKVGRVYPENGGWLTDEKLQDLRMEKVEFPYEELDDSCMLLRKAA